jgi:ParB-like nuclease domain
MIKCYFVDVKNISSALPRSSFDESELEQLAGLILATGGLLRPLILEESGIEKYTIIEGHREYYAAVRAKEKNLEKAEMVNAFVINSDIQQAAIYQLTLLAETKSANISTPTAIGLSAAQLSSLISTTIAQHLQPIVAQLDEHKQVLDLLNIDRQLVRIQNSEVTEFKQPKPPVEDQNTLIITIPTSPTATKTKPSTTTKSTKSDRSNQSSKTTSDSTTKSTKTTKTDRSKQTSKQPSKTISDVLKSSDPIKVISTLDLINALSQDMLTLRMKQSKINNAEKLATNIITNRNTQPRQKFDSWEMIIASKIPALGIVAIEKIIENLR